MSLSPIVSNTRPPVSILKDRSRPHPARAARHVHFSQDTKDVCEGGSRRLPKRLGMLPRAIASADRIAGAALEGFEHVTASAQRQLWFACGLMGAAYFALGQEGSAPRAAVTLCFIAPIPRAVRLYGLNGAMAELFPQSQSDYLLATIAAAAGLYLNAKSSEELPVPRHMLSMGC